MRRPLAFHTPLKQAGTPGALANLQCCAGLSFAGSGDSVPDCCSIAAGPVQIESTSSSSKEEPLKRALILITWGSAGSQPLRHLRLHCGAVCLQDIVTS